MKILAMLLASLVFFEACAGSVANTKVAERTRTPETTEASTSQGAEQGQTEQPKRKLWPWAATGVALGAVAAGVLIGVAVYAFSHMFDDTDFSGLSRENRGSESGGSTVPVVASR